MEENKDPQINIELDQEVAEGTYSNLAIINHSVSEFIVDFININDNVTCLVMFLNFIIELYLSHKNK